MKTLPVVLLIIGFGLLVAGFWWAGNWQAALEALALLVVCLALWLRGVKFAAGLTLALILGLSALGLWRGLAFPLAFAAVLCGLAGWDLEHFRQRLVFAAQEDHPGRLALEHMGRLGLVLGAGLCLSLATYLVHFEFSFEARVALAVVTFAGLGALVRRLRRA